MAGISDSRQPDDVKQQVEMIIEADDKLRAAPEGETEEQREDRESVQLPPWLRERTDAVLLELQAQVPGLTAAETAKLLASRAGRDALAKGEKALSRIDSWLHSATGERNPIIGKRYGVYGENPRTFAGVYRALELSVAENAEVTAARDAARLENAELAKANPDFRRVFSPRIRREVQSARDELALLINSRHGTRAELSRAVTLKGETLTEANAVITFVREHLYANLPDGKQDDDLRDYGYRPLKRSTRSRKTDPAPAPVNPVTE